MASRNRDGIYVRQPGRYLLRMLGFLSVVGLIVWLIRDPLLQAIFANPPLNGFIIVMLALGVFYTFGVVLNLSPEIKWLNRYRASDRESSSRRTPGLLAPMARLLGDRGASGLTPVVMRSLLDSVSTRLDESRDISRYLVGLLIFLGLLGTFWGLLQTISAIGDTISTLSVGLGPIQDSFEELRQGLEAPLGGMGTAFSSSLIGLSGSLILGFLDLQMAQAQNRFYNDVEEWLSENTDLEGGAYLDFSAGQQFSSSDEVLTSLAQVMHRTASTVKELSGQINQLAEQRKVEQRLIAQLVDSQSKLVPALEQLTIGEHVKHQAQYTEAIYTHLHNLDSYMQHMVKDSSQGRAEMVAELRQEIARVTQTILDLSAPQE